MQAMAAHGDISRAANILASSATLLDPSTDEGCRAAVPDQVGAQAQDFLNNFFTRSIICEPSRSRQMGNGGFQIQQDK
jgi:hypothetical protein